MVNNPVPPVFMRVALLVSLLLVATAPFIGEARRWLAAAWPDQYLGIVNGAVAAAAVVVAIGAARRIRRGWPWRVGLLVAAAAGAAVFTRLTGSPVPAVAAVEHFHFVQYGVITGLFYRAWRGRRDLTSLVWPMAAAVVFGTLEELWQWFLPARVGELDDVLLNVVAIACGLLVSLALAPLDATPRAVARRGWWSSAGAVGGVWLVVGAFTVIVHAGYRIEDADIGSFMSRYSRQDLARLSAERAVRWAVDPPLVRRTLAREDQYRSEGEAHVRARNAAWDAGDIHTAWRENLILERYYAPVLDTPSHISPAGHRWAPSHRRDAEERVRAAPPLRAPFTSHAAVDTRWQLADDR